jgi:radical SAM protein with 4Fe4S-binding SPASM domain
MRREVHQRIVEQCAEHGTALRYIGWGENLLHPEFVDFITHANKSGLLTHLNTNASKLTPELATRLVQAVLSSIKFSFQGVDRASYKEMRRIDFFDGMLKAIGYMREARGDKALPYIAASTSVTNETPEQIAAFRKQIEPLVDHVGVGDTIFGFIDTKAIRIRPEERVEFERISAREKPGKQHPKPCPEVYEKLSIQASGRVVVCCNSYGNETDLGNVMDAPLAAIWRHKVIEDYRKSLAAGRYEGPLCSNCFTYMEGTA